MRNDGQGFEVYIQVPAIDEPESTFRPTLRSFKGAKSDSFTPTYEAWVTPTEGRDVTAQVAREEGFDVYEAPKGKISARNAAHNHAFENGADAVISIDADAPLLNENAFQALVEPLQSGEAVACNSIPISYKTPEGDVSLVGAVVDLGAILEDTLSPHAHGQASSFTKGAWEYAGPFDESVDQMDGKKIRKEEEFDFLKRLEEYGDVVMPRDAVVYNDPRRHVCRLPGVGDSGYCNRIGGEVTFNPK